ncbi:GH92 family glycosyl hydrolase [Lacticaseibacillus absianus]|uniref:GH92 family glycosyl hydrolase n=1 Tax=Lacticaseibacillus absianus TaxID=2729623 RepID=UPI0015CB14B5|nr:GH92 family glycosyl hydrolase [Lacticaseibacillus absianus]
MNPDQIDTRIGTDSTATFSHGNTLPLCGVPFGMNYLSVQTTDEETNWWFSPRDAGFAGIRLTHQPSPWVGDFSSVLFTPVAQVDQPLLETYVPDDATFAPHRLALRVQEAQVTVEATANTTGGALHLSAHTEAPLYLRISAAGARVLTHTPERLMLAIVNFSGSEDPQFTMFLSLALPPKTTLTIGEHAVTLTIDAREATLGWATSFISADQANVNLRPLIEKPFDTQVAENRAVWQTALDQITIHDANPSHVSLFYHNFYRAQLFPMQFYEIDAQGAPWHYDTTSRQPRAGKMFTNNGFWDTYKTAFPLLSLLQPARYAEMLEGFYNSYLETGFLPRWLSPDERGVMPGTMLDAVIADAAVKGIATDLMPKFLAAMIDEATTVSPDPRYGREGGQEYRTLGYVPADIHESVNKTLDYAYSDWLISVVARAVGHEGVATAYAASSQNWRNLFDPELKLMRPKDRDGHFLADFDPLAWGNGYTEGSAWQNSFAVYQDLPGLIDACGGPEAFADHLHHLVNQPAHFKVGSYGQTIHEMRELSALPFGQLAISNQPSFHLPYLFTLANDPASTEVLVKTLLTQAFDPGFAGYPGDEDNGSMSCWVLFSSLGFYPVTPGSGTYVLGIPLFDEVTMHLPAGDLHLTTTNNQPFFNFVASRTFNGQPLTNTISHHTLMQGGQFTTKLRLLP